MKISVRYKPLQKFIANSLGKDMVDFANSDKDMIIMFMQFLRKVCGVDEKRLRVYSYFYSNQNIEKTEESRILQF